VTTSVLLAGAGWLESQLAGNAGTRAEQQRDPKRFLWFASADAAVADAVATLRKHLALGAAGIGEMKFFVPCDGPQMDAVYRLAGELRVPVLIHFQDPKYNTGLVRFHKVLERYPNVTFIGHAISWWSHVSAEVEAGVNYPTAGIKRGGITDRLLADYPNIHGDLSAKSGLGALTRDDAFARDFVARHARKLLFGSDCPCHDGKGNGFHYGYCVGQRLLARLREIAPDRAVLGRILHDNAAALLGLPA
jgi:predicted TIM-barrel fold metal-dependent hydrolase